MAKKTPTRGLSRREREMMDIVYTAGRISAADIREAMAEPPSYSAVRATLRVLVEKGHLRHESDGTRYLYVPTVPREQARESALKHLVTTFFGGSAQGLVATLLDVESDELSSEDLDRMAAMIDKAREEGR
ncbi:MAG: BlaI/MecI/CopY family transcriptional regulator [Acidobacteriota bacterium]